MSAPTMLDQLRDAVRTRCLTAWTVTDVCHVLGFHSTTAFYSNRELARDLLNQLTAEGVLTRKGDPGDEWTLAAPRDLDQFTEAVLRAVSAIPGVRFAAPVSDQHPGLIGVKVTATDDATYYVQVTR